MRVEFIYDPDCHDVTDARNNLREALAAAGWPRQWREWDRSKPDSPDYVRRYGSPTITSGWPGCRRGRAYRRPLVPHPCD